MTWKRIFDQITHVMNIYYDLQLQYCACEELKAQRTHV